MYLDYWGMERRPFENSHDLRVFVPHEAMTLALTKMRYVVTERLGPVCLHGPAGTGKTLLLNALLAELRQAGWIALYVGNPSRGGEDVLRQLLHQMGDTPPPEGASLLGCLEERFRMRAAEGFRIAVAVDEAHTGAGTDVLEHLRMLLNLEQQGAPLVQLLVAGQPPLLRRLEEASDFHSRIALFVPLRPMDEEETKTYVLYRLKLSGCTRGIFTRQAAEAIYRFSRGVPREVNRLCELSLFTGCGMESKRITPEIVAMAAEELARDRGQAFSRDTTAVRPRRAGADAGASAAAPQQGSVAGGAPAEGAPATADGEEDEEVDILASLSAEGEGL